MYEVWVEAPDFKGLSRVKQHKLITEVRHHSVSHCRRPRPHYLDGCVQELKDF